MNESETHPEGGGWVQREDGAWVNLVTGAGTLLQRSFHTRYTAPCAYSDAEVSNLLNDGTMRRIVMRPIETLVRGGLRFTYDNKPPEELKKWEQIAKERKVLGTFFRAMWMARAYGGAAVVKVFGKGDVLSDPAPEGQAVSNLLVLPATQIPANEYFEEYWEESWGRPKNYQLQSTGTFNVETLAEVDASRVIRFEGLPCTAQASKDKYRGWGLGTVQECAHVVGEHEDAWSALSQAISEWTQGVFKMKNLLKLMGAKNQDALQKRLTLANVNRGNNRPMMMDADTESFERLELQFGGAATIFEKVMMRLASAAEMPVTEIYGRSAAGMNATGDGDRRQYENRIEDKRVEVLPQLREILVSVSEDEVPEELELGFHPLSVPSASELGTLKLQEAQRYATYVNAGILFAEEVALGAFDDDPMVTVDLDMRETSLAQLKSELENEEPKEEPSTPGQAIGNDGGGGESGDGDDGDDQEGNPGGNSEEEGRPGQDPLDLPPKRPRAGS